MNGCLVARVGGQPKREFLLVRYGYVDVVNAAKGGPFAFTREHARQAVEWFRRLGRKLMIDFEHQSVDGMNSRTDGLSPAAGWIGRIEARADGLWAADVEWMAEARAMLASGQYAYYSPVIYWADREHRALDSLGPVALTNDPSMTHVEPLVASRLRVNVFAAADSGANESSPGTMPEGATQGDPRMDQDEAWWAAEWNANVIDEQTGRPLQQVFRQREQYVHYMKAVRDGAHKPRPGRQQHAATVAKRRAEADMPDSAFEAVLRREWDANVIDETSRRVQDSFRDYDNFAAYRWGVREGLVSV